MEKIRLHVGTVTTMRSGHVQDVLRPVEFQGELVTSRTDYAGGDDTRGVTESLYKSDSGRYVVYVEDWSKWQGESNVSTLHDATAADLDVGGRFEALGRDAGLGRPLTIDEALRPPASESLADWA